MSDLNHVTIAGHLTEDPKPGQTPNGIKYADMRVAINRWVPGRHGAEGKEYVEYMTVRVWNDRDGKRTMADHVLQYMKKTSTVYVEGRLEYPEWESEGKKKRMTRIVAEKVQFLDPPSNPGVMPANLNLVTISGRLTMDPEMRYLPNNGDAVCTLRIATNRPGSGDEKQADYHSVVLWRDRAKRAAAELRKGSSPIFVVGRFQTREYEVEGEKRRATDIVPEQCIWPRVKPGREAVAAGVGGANTDIDEIPLP